jgi:hypothetical protein
MMSAGIFICAHLVSVNYFIGTETTNFRQGEKLFRQQILFRRGLA